MINFGGLASILWTTVISYTLLKSVVLKDSDIMEHKWKYYLYVYGVSGVLTIIPILTKDFGPSITYCWIKNENIKRAFWFRMGEFYVPLILAIGYNLI